MRVHASTRVTVRLSVNYQCTFEFTKTYSHKQESHKSVISISLTKNEIIKSATHYGKSRINQLCAEAIRTKQ